MEPVIIRLLVFVICSLLKIRFSTNLKHLALFNWNVCVLTSQMFKMSQIGFYWSPWNFHRRYAINIPERVPKKVLPLVAFFELVRISGSHGHFLSPIQSRFNPVLMGMLRNPFRFFRKSGKAAEYLIRRPFRTFPENCALRHLRPRHQVRSSDPTSSKVCIATVAKFLMDFVYGTFRISYDYQCLQNVYIGLHKLSLTVRCQFKAIFQAPAIVIDQIGLS